MTSAAALSLSMRRPDGTDKRDGNPDAIYALITDGDQVHCMTELMLDAWWGSLAPADKADAHERWLDADDAVCEGMPAIEFALQTMRRPLEAVVAAAEELAQRHSAAFVPRMPTFSPAELSLLRRHRCSGR